MASKTAERRARELRKQGKRRFTLSIILFAAVFLAGGSFIALLLYSKEEGTLQPTIDLIQKLFLESTLDKTLVIFWLIVIPVILVLVLLINIFRRRKVKYYRKTWEETVKIAVTADREAYKAEQEKKRHTNRFSVLGTIEARPRNEEGEPVTTLEELCDRFRMFAANNLHLYYSVSQIREFISSLAVSHILILQGMSGTGKTSLTYAFGEFIGNPSSIIPVQPMWKERSDLLGYYNEFTRKYNETELLRKMYEANKSDCIYITVLDEMNIARVEYYFAEFLSLLEIPNPELRYLEVVTDKWDDDPEDLKEGRIRLPQNMWFVGTANNDDSTFAISDKVYDRAMIIDLDSRTTAFGDETKQATVNISYAEFMSLVENAQRGYEITRRNERRLKQLDEYLVEKFQITFGNRIMRQIRNYISVFVNCGGDELDALDDILCKKVLRKLTYKDLSLMRGELDNAAQFFETVFGEGKMPRCRSFLGRVTKL